MKIIEEKVDLLAEYLVGKAKRRSAIRYSAIYGFFDKGTPKSDIWTTFEEACRTIAPAETAIYGALMARWYTNIPSDGFYDIFRNIRHSDYVLRAGGSRLEVRDLSLKQKREIAQDERERVHQHAISIP